MTLPVTTILGRREIHFLALGVLEGDFHAALLLDAVELEQEVGVEESAAELAVGDAVQAQLFLELHHSENRLVLDRAQRRGVDRAFAEPGARLEQFLGTQEAADMICSERGIVGHSWDSADSEHRIWDLSHDIKTCLYPYAAKDPGGARRRCRTRGQNGRLARRETLAPRTARGTALRGPGFVSSAYEYEQDSTRGERG
ncbi:MAG: hypothetical protein WDN24_17505 [Sphingomonas sp.]